MFFQGRYPVPEGASTYSRLASVLNDTAGLPILGEALEEQLCSVLADSWQSSRLSLDSVLKDHLVMCMQDLNLLVPLHTCPLAGVGGLS